MIPTRSLLAVMGMAAIAALSCNGKVQPSKGGSSNSAGASGAGGSVATGGSSGADAAASSGAAGAPAPALAPCDTSIVAHDPCATEGVSCAQPCGPDGVGSRTVTCKSGEYTRDGCTFQPELDTSCYNIGFSLPDCGLAIG